MRYVKITRGDMSGSYVEPYTPRDVMNVIDGEFSDAELGEKITLELIEMTEEEYDALPEFQGW